MFSLRFAIRVRRAFSRIAGQDKLIDYRDWKNALGLQQDLLARRMFEMIDQDGSGYIDFSEFKQFAQTLYSGDLKPKLEFLFQSCDLDNSGRLSKSEVAQIIDADLKEQGLRLSSDKKNELVSSFFKQADISERAGLGQKSFTEFLQTQQGIENQIEFFIARLLGFSPRVRRRKFQPADWLIRGLRGIQNRWREVLWFSLFVFFNYLLFSQAMQSYALQGASLNVQVARGAGACLNFNAAMLILPMCKGLLGYLRHSFLYQILPLDDLTLVHKGFAFATIGFSLVHTAAHLKNYYDTQQGIYLNLISTVVGVTGVAMIAILLVMWIAAHYRKRNYEAFVTTHYLYALFLALLILHGPSFWAWFAPVLVLFLLDGLIRISLKYRRVEITELKPLSDQVTSVRFKRGRIFRFHPGDYIKVRIPAVSRWQWHPFTISAAPESTRVDIHVRNSGDWSGALHNLACKRDSAGKKWTAYIDGPYAAPTSSVYRARVAVLIAGGIGVTPFASVLQSLVLIKQRARRDLEQTVYFHWLNRSQQSYEWFIDLLTRAEKILGNDGFKLFIHLTSLSSNLSNIVMQLALTSYWKESEQDPITGLRARTSPGRPNWDRIFHQLREAHPDDPIDIYFCGPPPLGSSIRKLAKKHGLLYHDEKFE